MSFQAYLDAVEVKTGKTPREIRRSLKRYVIRELYRLLEQPAPTT